MTLTDLITRLRGLNEMLPESGWGSDTDPVKAHQMAEEWLLEYIGDKEVKELWDELSIFWFYA